jgi:predicted RNA-binding protein with PUA-like domain
MYWLVKSDPDTYGWEHFVKDGKTRWDGVRNYAARIHLKGMKKGDKVLFYHSQTNPSVVGIAKVAKEFYPDPTATEEGWVCVDLEMNKALKRLKNIPLIRIGRLSVMPVSKEEFDVILQMGK